VDKMVVELIPKVLTMVVLIAIGYTVSRKTWGMRLIDAVNLYLFYIAIPMATFIKVATVTSEAIFLLLTFLSMIHIFLVYVATYAIAKLFNASSTDAVSIALSLSLPNSLFLAIPLSLVLFGDVLPVLPYGVAYTIAVPIFIAMLTGTAPSSNSRKGLYMKSAPALVALILGFVIRAVFNGFSLSMLVKPVDLVISNSFYSSFIVVGNALTVVRLANIKSYVKCIGFSIPMKYLFSLILAVALLHIIQNLASIDRIHALGIIIQSVMPPAVVNLIFAKIFNLNYTLISTVLALLTPISVVVAIAATIIL